MNSLLRATLASSLLATVPFAAYAKDTPRQTEVEQESMRVMPFSMDSSMHSFIRTPDGGVQTVTVQHADAKQVFLVRSHLRKEAEAFARGDFRDPASIHGGTMPGLRAMRAGAQRIRVRYSEVRNGAAIAYTTGDPSLVAAIHTWFKAQVSDHGVHATMQM